MSYLSFDKTLLVNLDRSLMLEMIHTNRSGAYQASTLVGCNTRKYHGELVIPQPGTNKNRVLLASLDEVIVHHGAEFNLGIHQYNDNIFAPNGHKYIREFSCTRIAQSVYRLGNVILAKEKLFVSFEPRILIRYTLLDSGTDATIRFKPFLAFRNTDELTHENDVARTDMDECPNGRSAALYEGLPTLFMQFSKEIQYFHSPNWYRNIEYQRERTRGYEYKEDLLVPGYFELSLSKGESVIFSGGVTPVDPNRLNELWEAEAAKKHTRDNLFDCLKNAAEQFYKKDGDRCYFLAGYPWFGCTAREEFFSTPSCTLDIDNIAFWDDIIDKTAIAEVQQFMNSNGEWQGVIEKMDDPDALLWLIRAFQKYAHKFDIVTAAKKYAFISKDIINFYQQKRHPRCVARPNGLLYVDERFAGCSWMNAVHDGFPVTPRFGYTVELNALWYNALCFTAEMFKALHDDTSADLLEYQAYIVKEAFVSIFWNGLYLDDFVTDRCNNKEMRPNQIWAVGLPYSPLEVKQQKSVVDICTKELLTPRGLRTLSPKSGFYMPMFTGRSYSDRRGNYHNGVVWPFTIAAYSRAYMSIYKNTGVRFMERLLVGFEEEMKNLCVSTLSQFYDGTPPYKGHGAMSYAPSVAAVISIIDTIKKYQSKND